MMMKMVVLNNTRLYKTKQKTISLNLSMQKCLFLVSSASENREHVNGEAVFKRHWVNKEIGSTIKWTHFCVTILSAGFVDKMKRGW